MSPKPFSIENHRDMELFSYICSVNLLNRYNYEGSDFTGLSESEW